MAAFASDQMSTNYFNQPINLWYCQISWQLYLTTKNNLVWALATTGLAGSIVEQFYLC